MLRDFCKHYGLEFHDHALLKLALTHRSYLSVTGGHASESNERLEFLGDSVLGLVTSEHMFRTRPSEHEGQLTKTKSLLVSKAILSRRALAMGLGRFVLMSHSEIESGGRQRLSILADAFESVIGAIYLDLGFEASRAFIDRWLLKDTGEIVADKRHVNYKSHLQEYVQSSFRTHPVYRIRSEMGPDHSKHFMVEVVAGRRVLGEGRGKNKKEAEQAAARQALDRVTDTGKREAPAREGRERFGGRERHEPPAREVPPAAMRIPEEAAPPIPGTTTAAEPDEFRGGRRRGRRGGRGRRRPEEEMPPVVAPPAPPSVEAPEESVAARVVPRPRPPVSVPRPAPVREARIERPREIEPLPPAGAEDDVEEIGRPEGPPGERFVDPFASGAPEDAGAVQETFALPSPGHATLAPEADEEDEIERAMPGVASEEEPAAEPGSRGGVEKAPATGAPGGADRGDASSYGRRPGRGRR